MGDSTKTAPLEPQAFVEQVKSLGAGELHDLCDATDAAIKGGGGFGWVAVPERDTLERYWKGVLTMPSRLLFVARLDNVICGSAQLLLPPKNNEAQKFSVQLTGFFLAPWARGHNLGELLLETSEKVATEKGFSVINLDIRQTQTAAIKLYEKAGYVKMGTHPYYAQVDGEVVPGFYYHKVIDPTIIKDKE
jgi:ribosomal protein S18 acetylase RimI-like enzyme